ncbi:MAG: hypothetical protein ABSC23_15090 [Bryobacteraceae bacterium]|jgi:hypothetical protein
MSRTPRLVSPQRIAANRANAAKSTGPRTPRGRARSAQNARKHGFTASTFAVVRLEDLQEIEHLRADLVSVYQPINSQEQFAIERIALAQQAILRAARLEAGLFTTCLNQALEPSASAVTLMTPELAGDGDIEITRTQNRNFLLGVGFHRMAHQSNSLALFLRYQAQSERNYRRAVQEFERLRGLRDELPEEELPNEPTIDLQPEQNEPPYAPPKTDPSVDPDPPDPMSGRNQSARVADRPNPGPRSVGCNQADLPSESRPSGFSHKMDRAEGAASL